MIDLNQCIHLGTITKTHGVHGQIALHLKHIGFNNIQKMESVFIEIDGLPVPFFISDYTQGNNESLILEIDDISTPDEARKLIDCSVWLHRDAVTLQIKEEAANVGAPTQLIGYKIHDTKLGELGILEDILDFERNPLLQIIQGKKEILLPLQQEFIIEIDDALKIISVTTPEGLLDLF